MDKPTMHCQEELLNDLNYKDFLTDELLLDWFRDYYSTSKHLLTLYSAVMGLNAKNILEVGFGRSSFVLAKAASETGGRLVCCDTRDFSYLLNEHEKKVGTFIHGKSDEAWEHFESTGIDFAFLDYFSDSNIPASFVKKEIKTCLKYLKTNGILAIHDTIVEKYRISQILAGWPTGFWRKDYEVLSLPYNYGLGLIRKVAPSKYGTLEDDFIKKSEK